MHLTWAAVTHPGLRRPVNEDSFRVQPDLGLFVVADGMGGHAAGEVASRIAVEAIERFVADTVGADEHSTWPFSLDLEVSLDANRLQMAFQMANRRIGEAVAADEGRRGMATTASGVLIRDNAAAVGHVGDSRVYLLREGRLERVTRDHSWVEDQVRSGAMSAGDARSHPWRNIVTRALSGGEVVSVDLVDLELQAGDRLLLCSDGLSGVVPDDRIAGIAAAAGELEPICQALVDAANAAGGPDNVTAVLLQVDAG